MTKVHHVKTEKKHIRIAIIQIISLI